MEWAKDWIILLMWGLAVVGYVLNEIRKGKKYITIDDCDKCKERWAMHENQLKEDIRDIKQQLIIGDTLLTKLGVIQVAMCKHIDMPKEDIEMFKDAIYNGREIRKDI